MRHYVKVSYYCFLPNVCALSIPCCIIKCCCLVLVLYYTITNSLTKTNYIQYIKKKHTHTQTTLQYVYSPANANGTKSNENSQWYFVQHRHIWLSSPVPGNYDQKFSPTFLCGRVFIFRPAKQCQNTCLNSFPHALVFPLLASPTNSPATHFNPSGMWSISYPDLISPSSWLSHSHEALYKVIAGS